MSSIGVREHPRPMGGQRLLKDVHSVCLREEGNLSSAPDPAAVLIVLENTGEQLNMLQCTVVRVVQLFYVSNVLSLRFL